MLLGGLLVITLTIILFQKGANNGDAARRELESQSIPYTDQEFVSEQALGNEPGMLVRYVSKRLSKGLLSSHEQTLAVLRSSPGLRLDCMCCYDFIVDISFGLPDITLI